MATQAATKRLTREYANITKNPPPFIIAHPSESNILEWHYILTGPPDTPYTGGQYWGTLLFPPDYPFAPPAIRMHTPSGRFQPSSRLCLSISDFHPKSFNPAWEVSTILIGLMSFMTSEEMTTGSVRATESDRKAFARRTRWWNSTGGGSTRRRLSDPPAAPVQSPSGGPQQQQTGQESAAAPPPQQQQSSSNTRGVGAIKVGDGGAKFRQEWPELDEENWRWMREYGIDPKTCNRLAGESTSQQQQQSSLSLSSSALPSSSCAPEADALRRRLGPGVPSGIGAVMGNGRQQAREAGQGWLGRNKWKVAVSALFAYILLARLMNSTGQRPS